MLGAVQMREHLRWIRRALVLAVVLVVVAVAGQAASSWYRAGTPRALPAPPGSSQVPRGPDDVVIQNALTGEVLELRRKYGGGDQAYYRIPDTGWSQIVDGYDKLLGSDWHRTARCSAEGQVDLLCVWQERTSLWPRAVEVILLQSPAVHSGSVLIVATTRGR
jgi:hypothetical protein